MTALEFPRHRILGLSIGDDKVKGSRIIKYNSIAMCQQNNRLCHPQSINTSFHLVITVDFRSNEFYGKVTRPLFLADIIIEEKVV